MSWSPSYAQEGERKGETHKSHSLSFEWAPIKTYHTHTHFLNAVGENLLEKGKSLTEEKDLETEDLRERRRLIGEGSE